MQVRFNSAIYTLLVTTLILLVGCDSSGSSTSPDSVAGTWTGSRSFSADTTGIEFVSGERISVNATGQITRSYQLVIGESGSDLSVEITIDQTGFLRRERETGRIDSVNLDESVSYTAGGTYGPPTLIVTDVFYNGRLDIRADRWEFRVENGIATGNLGISLENIEPDFWESAIESQAESKPLTLERQ